MLITGEFGRRHKRVMTTGHHGHHTDCGPRPSERDPEYDFTVRYDGRQSNDEYGAVAQRVADSVELEHPVDDVAELRKNTHLEAQAHQQNRADWDEKPQPNDGGVLYDVASLQVMDDVLKYQGVGSDTFSIPERRFKLCVLNHMRNELVEPFRRRLSGLEPVLTKLGYTDGLCSYKTLLKALNKKLPEELAKKDCTDAFEDAVTQAVYAVFRDGVVPPESVREKYGFDAASSPLNERDLPRDTEQTATQNYLRVLLDESVDQLSFPRESGDIDMEQFMALLAHSAKTDTGLQEVVNDLDYVYPRGRVPSGSGLPKYVKNLPRTPEANISGNRSGQPITAQFNAANRAVLDAAKAREFFGSPVRFAVDMFRIDWTGTPNAVTVNRPKRSADDVRSEWTFVLLGIIDTEARFTLGVRMLNDKSQYPAALRSLAEETIPEYLSAKSLYADSELVSGELLNVMQSITKDNWAVRAPDYRVIKRLKAATPNDCIGVVPKVSWNKSPKPAAFAYPTEGPSDPDIVTFTERDLVNEQSPDEVWNGQKRIPEYGDDDSAAWPEAITSGTAERDAPTSRGNHHAAYLVPGPVSAGRASHIHSTYAQRWAIEESVNQVSNVFIPRIESADPRLRLYAVSASVLFQNWHTLINRSVSPELKMRLNVSRTEMLRVIAHLAFGEST